MCIAFRPVGFVHTHTYTHGCIQQIEKHNYAETEPTARVRIFGIRLIINCNGGIELDTTLLSKLLLNWPCEQICIPEQCAHM